MWVALEEVRDPGNLGTIIRTADAVGAAGIMLIGSCCDPYSHECVRATMGSVFAVPLARMTREAFLGWAGKFRGDVVGTHLDARGGFPQGEVSRADAACSWAAKGRACPIALTAACTRLVKIPMAGRLDWLNLAVATALVLYQIRGPHLKL